MRHERIPIEVKLAKDASKCRPCPPAYNIGNPGMAERTGVEPLIHNAPSTSALKTGVGGGVGGEMDWLELGGGLDDCNDPLSSFLVRLISFVTVLHTLPLAFSCCSPLVSIIYGVAIIKARAHAYLLLVISSDN